VLGKGGKSLQGLWGGGNPGDNRSASSVFIRKAGKSEAGGEKAWGGGYAKHLLSCEFKFAKKNERP